MRDISVLALLVLLPASSFGGDPGKTARVEFLVLDAGGKPVPDAIVYVGAIAGKTFKPPEKHYVMSTINTDEAIAKSNRALRMDDRGNTSRGK